MVEKPSNIGPKNSPQKPQAPKEKLKIGMDISSLPDPFPSMKMDSSDKKMFWSNLCKQMGQMMNHNLQRMKKALEKLKKSETE